MTITSLFQQWNALRARLADPLLAEEEIDRLAGESMLILHSVTQTAAVGLAEVLLKLEIYSREVAAGPCAECDALLGSVLKDRIALLGTLGQTGGPAMGPRLLEHPIFDDDFALHFARRGQNPGSPYP